MAQPQRFRKKLVVIEAMEYRRDDVARCVAINEWVFGVEGEHEPEPGTCGVSPIVIDTLEGGMDASVGDWIIRGVKGEFYPCKPDIFAATYEPVAAGDTQEDPA
jgi:hypothetical protein